MKYKVSMLIAIGIVVVLTVTYLIITRVNLNFNHAIGDVVDNLNGVNVYYNGSIGHTGERNTSNDGYNIGLCYQCVEFVKRYYYERFSHKMPDSYGHAKDFYDRKLQDGQLNTKRNLLQFKNGCTTKPAPDDMIVFSSRLGNPFGHVAIVSNVGDNTIEVVQQNPGPFGNSRETYNLSTNENQWRVEDDRVLGWLRLPVTINRRGWWGL